MGTTPRDERTTLCGAVASTAGCLCAAQPGAARRGQIEEGRQIPRPQALGWPGGGAGTLTSAIWQTMGAPTSLERSRT